MATDAPYLAARGVSKSFFGNPVLRDVSIELYPGRIHALLGENGAGKSTLINLLSGAMPADRGTIEIDGNPVPRMSPAAAQAAGIAVVQQELSVTGSLSIAENIGLGSYPRRFGIIDYTELSARTGAAASLVGLHEPLSMPVGNLPLGRRQMVEIAKALYRKPRVLILDEPTSSLSASEARILTELLQKLKGEGVAILFISHRLPEVMALCQHVTILKDGVRTADRSIAGIDADGLVRLMVGRDPGDLFPHWTTARSRAKAIAIKGFSSGLIREADLEIKTGEVLGIGGLAGQGQEDLLLGLYGATPAETSAAEVNGNAGLPRSVSQANAMGIAYVPADRKREGLHISHPIITNLLLPGFARAAALRLRNRIKEGEIAKGLAAHFAIKGDLDRPAQALSGGNQQKVALAKWMPHQPQVLLLNDPTRGVDVETKREIYIMLRQFASDGKAVVLLSSDTPELVHLCDRVVVIREGRIVSELQRADLSEQAIVAAAVGAEPTVTAA